MKSMQQVNITAVSLRSGEMVKFGETAIVGNQISKTEKPVIESVDSPNHEHMI